MAVAWYQVWPQQTAGTAAVAGVNAKRGLYIRDRFRGNNTEIWWTSDATSSGDELLEAGGGSPPCVIPMVPVRGGSTWGQIGMFGPIIDSDLGTGEGDLFFVRSEYTSSRWKTNVFAGGDVADDFAYTQSHGKNFFLFVIG